MLTKNKTCRITPQINQEDSQLYRELLERFPRDIANSIYAKLDDTELDSYADEVVGDTEKWSYNSQGQPTVDSLLRSEHIRRTVGSEHKLFKFYVDADRQLRTRLNRIQNSTAKNREKAAQEIKDLQEKMKGVALGKALFAYAQEADSLLKRSREKLLVKEKPTARELLNYRDIAKSYQSVLSPLVGELSKLRRTGAAERIGLEPELLNDMVAHIENALETAQMNLEDTSEGVMESVAGWLYDLAGKAPVTAAKIKQFLKLGEGDVGTLTRWFSSASSSRDDVVALMTKGINTAKEKARLATARFVRELIDENRLYEETMLRRGVDIKNPEKLYDPILKDGRLVETKGKRYHDMVEHLRKLTTDADGMPMQYREVLELTPEQYNALTAEQKKKREEDIAYNEVLQGRKADKGKFYSPERWDKESQKFVKGEVHYYVGDYLNMRESYEVYNHDLREWVKAPNVTDEQYEQYLSIYYKMPVEVLEFDKRTKTTRWKTKRYVKDKYIALHNEDYMEPKYLAIYAPGNESVRRYYEFITQEYVAMQQNLPEKMRIGLALPQVAKDSMETFLREGINFSTFRKAMGDKFKRKEGRDFYGMQDETGEAVNMLPIYFTSKIDESELSLDVGKSMALFAQMAYDYGEMDKVVSEVELTMELLADRDVYQKSGLGKKITNFLMKRQGIEDSQTVKGAQTQLYAQMKDYVEMMVYGQKINREEFFGGITEKHIDAFLNFNFMRSLSLNFFSAVSNITTSGANQLAESVAASYYTPKDYALANKQYFKNMTLLEYNKRKATNKLNLFNAFFDVGDAQSDFEGASTVLRLLDAKHLMALDKAGDHFNKTRVALAVANNYKVTKDGKELLDANGEPYKLFDVLEIDQNLNFTKKIDFDFTEQDRIDLTLKMRRINQLNTGTQKEGDRVAAKRYALGRAVMAFRNWIEPGLRRRFEFKRDEKGRLQPVYDYQLDDYRLGNYIGFWNYMTGGLLQDIKKLKAFSASDSNWSQLTEIEKAGVRRTIVELAYMLTAFAISQMLYRMVDYDDDESLQNKAMAFTATQFYRLYNELGFFTVGLVSGEAMKIASSPAAALNTVENIAKMMFMFFPRIDKESGEWNLPFNDVLETGTNKGEYRILSSLVREVPILTVFERFSDINREQQ